MERPPATLRLIRLVLAGLVAGCGGAAAPSAPAPAAAPAPPEDLSPPVHVPLLPAIDGEVIGMPGEPVPGLHANYVWTGLGWLGTDDDVVFEAVIQYRPGLDLGCGILRRTSDGNVHPVLMQDQPLPGTGGGRVKHPGLPLESGGDVLLMPALVDGGTVAQGLFAVPKGGGTPVLVHGETTGEVTRAEYASDGSVLAEIVRGGVVSVLRIEAGGAERTLCTGCAGGFSTDGATVVVTEAAGVRSVALDGTSAMVLGVGAPAPGTSGRVTAIRSARLAANGDAVVHAATDDPARREVLLRFGAQVEVVAAGGADAPGTLGRFGEIHPAAGRSDDIVFGASLEGDVGRGAGIFRARPGGAPDLLAADGALASPSLPLGVLPQESVAGAGGRSAFAALLYDPAGGGPLGAGVFAPGPGGALRTLVTTNARAATMEPSMVIAFDYEVREGVALAADGRALVHAALRLDRLPDASLGVLILVR